MSVSIDIHLPEQVAAEQEAEHEDEKTYAQNYDVDVQGEVVNVGRHCAVSLRALET